MPRCKCIQIEVSARASSAPTWLFFSSTPNPNNPQTTSTTNPHTITIITPTAQHFDCPDFPFVSINAISPLGVCLLVGISRLISTLLAPMIWLSGPT